MIWSETVTEFITCLGLTTNEIHTVSRKKWAHYTICNDKYKHGQ